MLNIVFRAVGVLVAITSTVISLSAPTQTPTEVLRSVGGIDATTAPTEATVRVVVTTDNPQEFTTIITKSVDTTVPPLVNVATPQEEVDTVAPEEEVDTVAPQEEVVDTVAPQEEVDTVAPQGEEVDTVAPQEEVDTVPPQEEVDTTAFQVTTNTSAGREVGGGAVVTLEKNDSVPTRSNQLVKCFCGGQEVLTPSGCQRFQAGTRIHLKGSNSIRLLKSVAEMDVVVHDLHCDVEDDHRELKFTKGQFYLRKRGDVVLLDGAGYLKGLRINNYCVTHHLDDKGELTWVMKACVPPPSVPTCCLPGQALKGGECHPASTPDLLTPPMSAEPFKDSIEWPVIRNYHNPVSCTNDPLIPLAIPTEKSHLTALPIGVMHTWLPTENIYKRKFTYPPKFCVDAQQNLDGSVKYFANLCYSNPEERHHKICDGNICVRKCCGVGEIMDTSLHRCVAFPNATFDPPFATRRPQYKTVTGYPLCAPQSQVDGISVNDKGYLLYKDRTLPPTDYCVDKFSNSTGEVKDSALVCLTQLSAWDRARNIVFPIAQSISLLFLLLTLLCYCLVPKLLQKGGWYQLCHVLSLMVAYTSALIQMVYRKVLDTSSCIAMGLVMQFGFLATFFWLSVLCFEVWRKIRSLNKLLPPIVMPVWVYPLYAFGGPFAIGVITTVMQFLAPENIPGVIKPYLGVTKCWFIGDFEMFIYFYGPIAFLFACNIAFIAHTFLNYRKIEDNSTVLRNLASGLPKESSNPFSEHRHRRRDYIADFKQQFSLLVLMSSAWVTEVLSWKIPPPELWALTDVLNSLQGFFIFVIFMANRSKRKHIKERFPKLLYVAKQLKFAFQKVKSFFLCKDMKIISLLSISRLESQVSRKLSLSSVVSNLSTLSMRLSSTSSSLHVTSPEGKDKRSSSVNVSEEGITTLSHSKISLSYSNDSVFSTAF